MLLKPIHFLIAAQEKRHYTVRILFLFSLFVGIVRAFEEILFFRIPLKNSEIVTFVAFYFSLGWYLTAALALVSGISWKKVNLAVVIGIFLGTFPPFFDLIISGRTNIFYGYYYLWSLRELPWLGYKPHFNYPLGEAITIWLSILFCGVYVFIKTSSFLRTFLGLIAGYVVFLLHGSFLPMLVTNFYLGPIENISSLKEIDSVKLTPLIYHIALWQTLMALWIYFILRRELMLHLAKRVLHTLPFVMVSLIGGAIAKANNRDSFMVAFFTFLAALGTLIQNDWFDRHEDEKKAPVEEDDIRAYHIFFFLASLFLFMMNFRSITVLLLAYFTSFLYNYPFYRARNSFPANLKIEGVWGGSSYLAGLLLNPQPNLGNWQLLSIFLVFGGFSLVAMLKDAKDFERDLKNNVKTIYTIMTKRGIAREKIHFIVRSIASLLFTVPCLWLMLQYSVLIGLPACFLGPIMIFVLTRKNDTLGFQLTLTAILFYFTYIYGAVLLNK